MDIKKNFSWNSFLTFSDVSNLPRIFLFYRAMLRIAQRCYGKTSVRPWRSGIAVS